MIVGYILYINIYIYCQVCASLGGYSIQLWNKLLTNKKAANPTDPPPLILDSVSSPLFHHKSSSRVFGEKRKKKVPFYFVCGLHHTSWSCVWIFARTRRRTEKESFGSSLLDGQKRPILEQTLIHWRSWLKQPTSSHSAVFQKRHTGYTQDVCRVLFFNLYNGLSFLFSPFSLLIFVLEFSHL